MIYPYNRKSIKEILDLIKNNILNNNCRDTPYYFFKKSVDAYNDLYKEVEDQLNNIENIMQPNIKELGFRAREGHLFGTIEKWAQVFWYILSCGTFYKYDNKLAKDLYVFGKPRIDEVMESILVGTEENTNIILISSKGIEVHKFPFIDYSKHSIEVEEQIKKFVDFTIDIYYASPFLISEKDDIKFNSRCNVIHRIDY